MEEDEELESIRQRKLRQLMKKASEKTTEGANQKQEKPAPKKPVEVTDATFTEILQNHPLVVIDCWAPWCAPCHMVAPILEEMAQDYAGKILFGKLNVDKNRKVAM